MHRRTHRLLVFAMPKLKPETLLMRYEEAQEEVAEAESQLAEIAAEGSRLDGVYLCTSHPSGTSYGGNREQQVQRLRWQLTRKDGSSYPKGTLGYEEAFEQCDRAKRYAAASKRLGKARKSLAKWQEKLSALGLAVPSPRTSEDQTDIPQAA